VLAFDIVLGGLILGGMYALVATGLTLQYGVARIMNLAYGEVLVAAAFGSYLVVTAAALSPLLGLVLIVPAGFGASWLVYRFLLVALVKRAKTREALEVDSILATFGLLFVVQGLAFVLFGGQYYSYSYLSVPVTIAGSTVPANRLLAFTVAAVLAIGIYAALMRTRTGTAIRAVAVDPNSARLVGIDVERIAGFAFALGGALCAAGGVLVSMFLTFNAAMGVVFTMKALVVVIMGGVGNLMGALVAGLLLGLVETSVARLVDPGLTLAATFGLFLTVLLVKPTGLFGRAGR
jgi:branched-chain amino acid transport system permease protein